MPSEWLDLGFEQPDLDGIEGHGLTENNVPSKTPKQRRAMQAAAKGKSKLGIPRKVGKEYVRADRRKK